MRILSFGDLERTGNEDFLVVIKKLNGIAYDIWTRISPVNKDDKRYDETDDVKFHMLNQAAYDMMIPYDNKLQQFEYKDKQPMKPLSAIEMGALMAYYHGAGNCDLVSHVTNLKILHELDFRPFDALETDVILEREPTNHSYVLVRLYTKIGKEKAVYTCVVDPWAVEPTLDARNFKGVATADKFFIPPESTNCDLEQSNRKTSFDAGMMVAVKKESASEKETTHFKKKEVMQYACRSDFFERVYEIFQAQQKKSIFSTYNKMYKNASIGESGGYGNQSLVPEDETNSVFSLSPSEQLEREEEMSSLFTKFSALPNAVPYYKDTVSKYKGALEKIEEEVDDMSSQYSNN